MSHYLYSRATELGKNTTTRGNNQLYLTVYSVTFITTGCICACEVKVSDPCSHESFSALMENTPGAACWNTNSSGRLVTLLTPEHNSQVRQNGRGGDIGAWDGWELNRGCWWRWALRRRRIIFNWMTKQCCCGPAIAPLHVGCLSFKAEESFKMKF